MNHITPRIGVKGVSANGFPSWHFCTPFLDYTVKLDLMVLEHKIKTVKKNSVCLLRSNEWPLYFTDRHIFLCFSGLLFVFLKQLFTWILFESAMKLMWFTILWHFCWRTFPLNMPLKWFCLTSLKSNTSFLAVPYPPGGWASMGSHSTINIHNLSTASYEFPIIWHQWRE